MSKIAQLDCDIFIYRVGYTTNDKEEGIAVWRLDNLIDNILEELGVDKYVAHLTSQDKSNFRYEVDPNYKSNRVIPKPVHYLVLREHLIKKHNAQVAFEMEADDAIAIEHVANGDRSIIVSIDKDLNQVPGSHYNFVKKERYEVSRIDGTRFFYKQIITGDNADGVKGIKGIGPVKADKALRYADTETEMFLSAFELYQRAYGRKEVAYKELTKAGQLLKIKQTKDEPLWLPPVSMEDTDLDLN